jgi:16S rRNA processing protein RimM
VSNEAEHWIELGEIGRPHGVRGDLLVQSYTDPPLGLARYALWQVGRSSASHRPYRHAGARVQGRGLVVRLEGLSDRDQAAQLTGCRIFVASSELPVAPEGQHYWSDLIGLAVRNLAGVELGRLEHFIEAPGNPVMVVVGQRTHWVPLTDQHLRRVDRAQQLILVDWPEDF